MATEKDEPPRNKKELPLEVVVALIVAAEIVIGYYLLGSI